MKQNLLGTILYYLHICNKNINVLHEYVHLKIGLQQKYCTEVRIKIIWSCEILL
jgi:hypothetical protein